MNGVVRNADNEGRGPLTVADTCCFGVAIYGRSPQARVDWRADYDALDYQPVAVPADVQAGIGAYLDMLGLRFGVFDFIVGTDGDWTFLECNSNGQWGWLADCTGLPIADAVARTLLADTSTGDDQP